ncbi:Ribosomal protein S18 acetylase RimI [Micromonospora echinaurantiaca]|uniref:Ribosomal protein S18 acetylase RimI n=1 Tax=Micromonospora echinaurantiaca TaxID=47857 RepID=A0A1C5IFT9_9ACTN|nr:GNAT family N-acetyltransferase [Micromonospora echinaurantiaca]SCG57308.1 Ribosomal protein S18 acetylase RimI [Micromonospora echinaurantiaca]
MIVRFVQPADLSRLAQLCAEHALYERADPVSGDLANRLAAALFSRTPRLWCLVAADQGYVVGYATLTREFSTWRGRDHLHLDCLYVTEAYRNNGVGRSLLAAAVWQATELGMDELQWQTPEWNADAIRFYDRLGARSSSKLRYQLPIPAGVSAGSPRCCQPLEEPYTVAPRDNDYS